MNTHTHHEMDCGGGRKIVLDWQPENPQSNHSLNELRVGVWQGDEKTQELKLSFEEAGALSVFLTHMIGGGIGAIPTRSI